MFTQQETVKHCLLFILQPNFLHNLSPHTSSQPITSRITTATLSIDQSNRSPGFLNFQLTKKITFAQVVQTSVANNSLSQHSNHPDDIFQSRYVTPGFKPFSYKHIFLRCFKVEASVPEPAEIEKANVQSKVPERNSHVFNLSNCSVVFEM